MMGADKDALEAGRGPGPDPGAERARLLDTRSGQLELATAMHCIGRALDELSGRKSIKDMRVLELFAGHGEFSLRLARRGLAVFATDPDEVNLDAIRGRVSPNEELDITVERADAVDLSDYPSGMFDLVLLLGSIGRISRESRAAAVAEASRVCSPGGWAVSCSLLDGPDSRRDWPGFERVILAGADGGEGRDGDSSGAFAIGELGARVEEHLASCRLADALARSERAIWLGRKRG